MLIKKAQGNEEFPVLTQEEIDGFKQKVAGYDIAYLNKLINDFQDISAQVDRYIAYQKYVARQKGATFEETKLKLLSLQGDIRGIIEFFNNLIPIPTWVTLRDFLGIIGQLIGVIEEIKVGKEEKGIQIEKYKPTPEEEKSVRINQDYINDFAQKDAKSAKKQLRNISRIVKELKKLNRDEKYRDKPLRKASTQRLYDALTEEGTDVSKVKQTNAQAYLQMRVLFYKFLEIFQRKYPEEDIAKLIKYSKLSPRETIKI
jgi:hypothetical protein